MENNQRLFYFYLPPLSSPAGGHTAASHLAPPLWSTQIPGCHAAAAATWAACRRHVTWVTRCLRRQEGLHMLSPVLNAAIPTAQLERSGEAPSGAQSEAGFAGGVRLPVQMAPGHPASTLLSPSPSPPGLRAQRAELAAPCAGERVGISPEHISAPSAITKPPEAGGRESYLLLRANEGAINRPFCLEIAEKPQSRAGVSTGRAVGVDSLREQRSQADAGGEGGGEGKEVAAARPRGAQLALSSLPYPSYQSAGAA